MNIHSWNNRVGPLADKVLFSWRDPITRDLLGIVADDWKRIVNLTIKELSSWHSLTLETLTKAVYKLFSPNEEVRPSENDTFHFTHFCLLPSFRLSGATVADRALLCSAVAYCLAYENGFARNAAEMTRLRLSALFLEFAEIAAVDQENSLSHPSFRDFLGLQKEAKALCDAVWTQAGSSPVQPLSPYEEGDLLGKILGYASLVASNPSGNEGDSWQEPPLNDPNKIDSALLTIKDKSNFSNHPLALARKDLKVSSVALILCGATRIKNYFLETSRLPEIRGASALLDRINLEDAPALFGDEVRCLENQRYEMIRKRSRVRLTAPECIIYANGGNILAFAPISVAADLAQEIENIYSRETLVANSVGVSETFELMELQYGFRPWVYWSDDFFESCGDSHIADLLDSTYRFSEKISNALAELTPRERIAAFLNKKCFGELGTVLALKQYYRREGNEVAGRASRAFPPHYEILPQARRCSSCERRPAIIEEPEGTERYLCAACARKRMAGRSAKAVTHDTRLSRSLDWDSGSITNWGERYLNFLDRNPHLKKIYFGTKTADLVISAQDLEEIADSHGFVGLIYADGNNVGSIIETIRTAAEYRQFAQRLFFANQEAVFSGIANGLRPHDREPSSERPPGELRKYRNSLGKITIHPFEIVSIGGDDVFLFVPGEFALDVTLRIALSLEKAFAKPLSGKEANQGQGAFERFVPADPNITRVEAAMSLSAGVVIADCRTPVYFMEQLASQLLKSSKRYAKDLKAKGYKGGTVDFMALKSVALMTSELVPFRRKALERKSDNESLKLYSRPYTLLELQGLMETARAFKKNEVPRSQLYSLRNDTLSHYHSRLNSTLNYLYFRARARTNVEATIRNYFEERWCSKGTMPIYPWRKYEPDSYETILYDLVEIYDFVSTAEER